MGRLIFDGSARSERISAVVINIDAFADFEVDAATTFFFSALIALSSLLPNSTLGVLFDICAFNLLSPLITFCIDVRYSMILLNF